MRIHLATVSIERAPEAAAPEIFDLLDYKIVGDPVRLQKAADLDAHWQVSDPVVTRQVQRVVYVDGDWTHIAEYQGASFEERLLWKDLSKRWNNRIVCWVCDWAWNYFAYSLYENGELIREVIAADGKVTQVGEPLPEETELEWEEASVDDLFVLIEHFGILYDGMEEDREYCIYKLEDL